MNIDVKNFLKDINLDKNELISPEKLSTKFNFASIINEFTLEFENNGLKSSNNHDEKKELILYNLIYEMYNNLNSILDSNVNIDLKEKLSLIMDNKNLNLNDFIEIENYICNELNINDINFETISEKIKSYINDLEKSNNNYNAQINLENLCILNLAKIDNYSKNKNLNDDINYLESVVSNNSSNMNQNILLRNNSLHSKDINNLDNPISEIRADFIYDDMIKAVKYIKLNDLEELNIKFAPRELGEINIKLSKNDEDLDLLITIDDNTTFDIVNRNIEDIKSHFDDINFKINDISITNKSEDKDLFLENFSQEFEKEGSSKQERNTKYKNDKDDSIDEVEDYNAIEDNLNILI